MRILQAFFLCAVPLEGTWRKYRKIEFLGFQIEFLDFWNEFLVFFDQNYMVFIEFLKKIPIFETVTRSSLPRFAQPESLATLVINRLVRSGASV